MKKKKKMMMMTKTKVLLSSFTLFFTTQAFGLEPQNPITLCERFLEGPARSDCEKKMDQWQPDWYLATVCNHSFEDASFYSCIQLTTKGPYSPVRLEACDQKDLSDADLLSCVTRAKTNSYEAFQQKAPPPRQPAGKMKQQKKKNLEPVPNEGHQRPESSR